MNDRNSNDEPKNFSFSDLMIGSRLGRGSTSYVFKTQSIRTKKSYAMKVIDKMSTDYKESDFEREIKIHKSLHHQNICQFVKHFEDEHNHYILTEYCRDGEITKFLLKPLTEAKLVDILQQLALAIHYMHKEIGIAHGDLKLSNILINGPHLKICDFGFSVDLTSKQQKSGAFGTLMYMSPEILLNNRNEHHKEADIWALGICMLTLMLQEKPYTMETNNGLKNQIVNGSYIKLTKERFPKFSQELLSLIGVMLEVDYKKRITIDELLDHPIFKKGIIDCSENKLEEGKNRIQESFGMACEKRNEDDKEIEKEKEDESKSMGNITFDTTDIETVDSSHSDKNLRMWSYCLQPQIRSTGADGFIEIQENRNVKIKVRKTEFIISPEGTFLEVISGMKTNKKYTFEQIVENPKVYNLYKYAGELIDLIKKSQCKREEIIDGKYFWISKKTIGCLINNNTILEKYLESSEKKETILNGCERVIEKDQKEMEALIFEKGEKSLLSRLE